MSEVLADVAEPLLAGLDLPEHEEAFRLCLMLAAAVWNAAMLETEGERQRAMAEVKRSLNVLMDDEMSERCNDVYRLARTIHRTETRVIAAVELVRESEDRFRIDVASAGG